MRLEVKNMSVRYGAVTALDDVSIVAPQGEITAIIGANGAGKSTLLNAVMGIVTAQAGSIFVYDKDVTRLAPEQRFCLGMALSPEGRRLFPEMTVRENILAGALRRGDRQEIAQDLDGIYALFPRLREREANLGRNLSGGEQQMCAIGRALIGKPSLLLLDEPSLGLAPKVVSEMAAAIKRIALSGVTIVLVEQNSRLALSLASQAYLLEAGRIAMAGAAGDMLADERLQDIYLGT